MGRIGSARWLRLAYTALSVTWAAALVLMWVHSVSVGTVTLTTKVLTVQGVGLSALILWALRRRVPVERLNALLLWGMTVWVVSRVSLRVLVEGSLQGVSFVLITGLTALAFTVLRPAAAVAYGVAGWCLLAGATLISRSDVWDVLIASAFAVLMVSYAALSGRQVISEREQRLAAERRASTDKLTGLLNRSGGEEALAKLARAAEETGAPATVILLDIDHFKAVNDRFGHAAGDEALRCVARALAEAVRAQDTVCRWGGEEFLLLLPGVSVQQAAGPLERLLSTVRAQPVPEVGHVTLSAGGCDLSEAGTPDEALKLADERLYAAKAAGRDRAVLA